LLPGLGERRPDVELFVAVDQELVDEAVDVVGEALVLRMRIGGLHVAAIAPAQRRGVADGGCCGADGKRDAQQAQNVRTWQRSHGISSTGLPMATIITEPCAERVNRRGR